MFDCPHTFGHSVSALCTFSLKSCNLFLPLLLFYIFVWYLLLSHPPLPQGVAFLDEDVKTSQLFCSAVLRGATSPIPPPPSQLLWYQREETCACELNLNLPVCCEYTQTYNVHFTLADSQAWLCVSKCVSKCVCVCVSKCVSKYVCVCVCVCVCHFPFR